MVYRLPIIRHSWDPFGMIGSFHIHVSDPPWTILRKYPSQLLTDLALNKGPVKNTQYTCEEYS